MIVQYVRDEKRNPIGAVVALSPTKVGFSLCHPRDKWDRKIGLKIAEGRAKQYGLEDIQEYLKRKVPYNKSNLLFYVLRNVVERAEKYYK